MKKNGDDMEFFNNLESPFEQSKDDIWIKLAPHIQEKPKTQLSPSLLMQYAVIAIVALFVSSASFLRFYPTTVNCDKGEHLSYILPDGSVVELNADTKISYKPFWWKFQRKLSLSGEAFFEVEKGKSFCVLSEQAQAQVVGTSFNILARDTDYKVFCTTGKVKVSSTKSDVNFIVEPGEMVVIDNINKIGSMKTTKAEDVIFWKENKFNFVSESVQNVFSELERQYNIEILAKINNIDDYVYTGFFEKSKNIDSTLHLICKTFNFSFIEIENNKYKVSQKL